MPLHKFDLAAAMAATETHTQAATELTLQELAYAYQAARCDDSDTRIRKWLPPFGLRSAWTIQTAEIEHAATAMLKSGFKPSSVNRDLSLIGSLYKWAIAQRLAPSGFISPTRAIRRYAEDIIKKSRRKIKTENNLCGYMLVDGKRRSCVHGSRWELTAGDMLRYCETESVTSWGKSSCKSLRLTYDQQK